MHVQLVQTSTSHCSLELYTVPWYKHDALESKTHRGTHTFPHRANMLSVGIGWLSYLGTRSSISLESSLVSDHLDTLQANTLQCYTQCSPAKEKKNALQTLLQYEYSLLILLYQRSQAGTILLQIMFPFLHYSARY